MWLIVGLGNPGKEYAGTRHNIGFEVINKLAYDNNIDINKAKFKSHIGEGFIGKVKVVLCKPVTFMNLSGTAVMELMKYYKPSMENVIIIYDDVSIMPGQVRIRDKGSAGGHNGMKNIIYLLETDEFLRIRVGIGEKPLKWDLADYVLSKFNKNEFEDIVLGVTKASEAAQMLLNENISEVMNKFNVKNRGKE